MESRAWPIHGRTEQSSPQRRRWTMSQLNGHARQVGPASRMRARAAAAVAGVIAAAAVAAVSVSTAANAASGCQVAYTANSWSGGFTASISITNLGLPITNWT